MPHTTQPNRPIVSVPHFRARELGGVLRSNIDTLRDMAEGGDKYDLAIAQHHDVLAQLDAGVTEIQWPGVLPELLRLLWVQIDLSWDDNGPETAAECAEYAEQFDFYRSIATANESF